MKKRQYETTNTSITIGVGRKMNTNIKMKMDKTTITNIVTSTTIVNIPMLDTMKMTGYTSERYGGDIRR